MNEIVSLIEGKAVTTTETIASETDVEHKAVIQLVRTYRKRISRVSEANHDLSVSLDEPGAIHQIGTKGVIGNIFLLATPERVPWGVI